MPKYYLDAKLISTKSVVRNLGVFVDNHLNLDSHVDGADVLSWLCCAGFKNYLTEMQPHTCLSTLTCTVSKLMRLAICDRA